MALLQIRKPAAQILLLGGSDDYPSVPPVEDFLIVMNAGAPQTPNPARLILRMNIGTWNEDYPPVPPVDDYMMIQTVEEWGPDVLQVVLRGTQDDYLLPPPPPPPPGPENYARWEIIVVGD